MVGGFNVTDPDVNLDKMRQQVGMVFQQFNLFPHLTVLENCTISPIKVLKRKKADAQKVADKIDGQTYVMIRQAGETGHLYGSVAGRDVAEAIQAEGGKVERSQVVLNTAIKSLGVHEVPVRLHAEVRATVKINIARSMDEAERQAKGEDVIRSQFDDERQAAEQSAQELIEGGAGQQEGFGDEA